MASVKAQLEELRALSSGLNEAETKAEEVMQALERILNDELELGISARTLYGVIETTDFERSESYLCWHRVPEEKPDEDDEATVLPEVRFHFVVLDTLIIDGPTDDEDDNEDEDILTVVDSWRRPWFECCRDDKLQSFKAVPELLAELIDRAADEIKRTEKSHEFVMEHFPDLYDTLL